ncbi:COR domain-containing protein [uncultured Kordia sp.]|uniref:COR domain-containing protein n=1 Tax=uncultured Kordia sp. TaxID=507699 RepID=UPI00261B59A0|nr:COR domain-containing protein [uncultured Kordia sp.]
MEEVHDINYARKLIRENLETKNPYLDLGNCGLKSLLRVTELFKCIHLKTLILSGVWKESTNLNSHSVNKGSINDINFLPKEFSNLKNLEKLVLSENSIRDIKILKYLVKLKFLDIARCEIVEAEALKNLVHLEHLNAGFNPFNNNQYLQILSNLKFLNIDYNNVNTNHLKNLIKLEYLSLSKCNITNCEFLTNLTKVTFLNLSKNKLINTDKICSLKKLKTLIIRHTKLDNFNFLQKIEKLENLNLNGNRNFDFNKLRKMNYLKRLFIGNCSIDNINFLEHLHKLEILILSNNDITDIKVLENLKKLKYLSLINNKIKNVPSAIFKQFNNNKIINKSLNSNELNILLFRGNPIQSPPLEILEQGSQATLDWYEANKVKLNEIKVILLGDPEAGKTSLLRRLKDNTFDEKEVQTDGINIESLRFGTLETFKKQTVLHKLTGLFWDFGGQEIMNATHQFFLTKCCVYVLVLESRKDTNSSEQIRQWINKIKTTGGNSSIIIVSNKIDINPGFGFENEYDLQQEFPQIKHFIKTSSKTNKGIEELKDKLAELIPQSELFNTEIDERWIPIKEQLQEETKQNDKLNETRFIEICQKHGLTKKSERQSAIRFLNDLGIVLHFEDIKLAEYYVLDPYWITYGIYQIVTSKFASEQNGKIAMDKLEFIINEEEDKETVYRPSSYKKIDYSNNERRFLVDILQQFKLSFILRDECHFILPDLLDTKEPKALTVPIRDEENTIQFVYEYAYLPKAIIPYIMVETHEIMVANWRTGCVLKHEECKALISTYGNSLRIIVSGESQKREFMSIIRYVIDSFNKKLSNFPEMKIPLPNDRRFADYKELLEREKDGESVFKTYNPKKEYTISQLLDGISSIKEVEKISPAIMNQIIEKLEIITKKLNINTEFLYQKLGKPNMEGELHKAIFQLNQEQQLEISSEITTKLASIFSGFEAQIEEQFKSIYQDLQKSDHTDVKLKLGIPLISLLGIQLEVDFDVKNWFKELSEKYNLKALIPFP